MDWKKLEWKDALAALFHLPLMFSALAFFFSSFFTRHFSFPCLCPTISILCFGLSVSLCAPPPYSPCTSSQPHCPYYAWQWWCNKVSVNSGTRQPSLDPLKTEIPSSTHMHTHTPTHTGLVCLSKYWSWVSSHSSSLFSIRCRPVPSSVFLPNDRTSLTTPTPSFFYLPAEVFLWKKKQRSCLKRQHFGPSNKSPAFGVSPGSHW